MQTRSTPSSTVLIWFLTNDIVLGAYLKGSLRHATPPFDLPFSKKEQMVLSDWNKPDTFNGFCNLWLGADVGGGIRVFTLPALFNYIFDKYNFSIISNLFDNNKLYALSTHNWKCAKKLQKKSYLEKYSELGSKNLNKLCLKNVQKAPK